MTNSIIQNIQQKATFLNNLSNNEVALFEYINNNKGNLDEVIQQYQPEREFKPVNTLRFLIANELKKGSVIDALKIEQLKQAIENRDVSSYFALNDIVKQSLANYKDSKMGMFPNWRHTFKILFPFIHNIADNEEVIRDLDQLADEIINANQLENVKKHLVGFQGSQNYGSDHVWLAIIPESSPSVQYAYQLFFVINTNGLFGGIHKGHNLTKQVFENQDIKFEVWEDYLEYIKQIKIDWSQLNSEVNFIFIKDEKDFIKTIKKVKTNSLSDYFKILDRLKEDLNIQDEEKLVFSLAKNRLSFQVGKRDCLNVNNNLFDFISNSDVEDDNINRENFSGEGSGFLYKDRTTEDILNNYEDIKSAIEYEIEQDHPALSKFYDNSAFRKAVFDKTYREKVLNQSGMQNKYFLVGAYWDSHDPKDQTERFVNNEIWTNGYDDKFNTLVNSINVGDYLAIKSTYVRGKTKSVMLIKARGIVLENLNDGQNLKLKWESDFEPFEVDFTGGYRATVKQVTNKAHINRIWESEIQVENVKQALVKNGYKAPINQIFYGPPGTGKTYNTILEAAKIITEDERVSYDTAQVVFNEHLGDRVEFITFHQNYSYEDFIQGLRPDTEITGELSFYKSDGVFKRISDRALKNLKDSENPASAKKEFVQVFNDLLKPLSEGDVEELEIKMKQTSFYITEVGEKSIEFRKNQGDSKHTLSINTLRKMYDKGANDIILGGLQPYYNPILKLLLDGGKSNVEPVQKQNYVIVIDEINRANISRVFGELITLIEKDKRSGGSIPLTATLPSGELFIVPSNLYIIGTMNTADKSIALLDIALRRRFEFVPMYPKYDLPNKRIYKVKFLKELNELIVKSGKGHDFTIGHSYFMDEDETDFDFERTINNKVIPLMLEYYMNDEGEVTKILNEALKQEKYQIGNWPLEIINND